MPARNPPSPSLPGETPPPGRRAPRLALCCLLAFVAAGAFGLVFKDRLIFHPAAEERGSPAAYGLPYEEFWLTTSAGDRVRAWRSPPAGGRGRPVLLFQGNSGNLSLMTDRLFLLNSLGLTVLAVDYPGYGPSSGRPSEEGVYQAAEALWAWAAGHEKAAAADMIFYGYSLGGGAAAYLAARHPPAALILDSTFTRLRDAPGYGRPWLIPYLKLILGEAFDTRSRLKEITCPLLVFHSPDDDVVPFPLGRELFESYRNNAAHFVPVQGDHRDFVLNLPLYRAGLLALPLPLNNTGEPSP